MINILTEQAELNAKYGRIFADQSESTDKRNKSENETEFNQSDRNRIFQKNREHQHVIKKQVRKKSQNLESAIDKQLPKVSDKQFTNHSEKMEDNNNREAEEIHWGATPEIMHVIRRRENSPETIRLIDRRLTICRPGIMRRRYDTNTQRHV